MARYKLAIHHARIATPQGHSARCGAAMRQLLTLDDATVLVGHDGRIAYVGAYTEAEADTLLDAKGRVLLPGFVDSHTHALFGGYRPDEFAMRMQGAAYMDIMRAGGGIQATVNATRALSAEQLADRAQFFLDEMKRMGVTCVEVKSGYGLSADSERAMLDGIALLRQRNVGSIDVVSTFLGAHAVPAEYKGRTAEYVDMLIADMLPHAAANAEYCDVFCERDVFELDDSRRLLEAARGLGMRLKLHADEIVQLGGAELAADLHATSADHLLHISDRGIQRLAEAGTVATLLPLTAFSLREEYAPARRMIDGGCAVALATDLNPGSCFSGSIPITFALACIYMHMSVEEAITALTLNGAAALDRADTQGSLEVGKQANMALLHFDNYAMLPYYIGMNCVQNTIYQGVIL